MTGTIRLLHVGDTDDRRGSAVFAADLVKALNEEGVTQAVVVLMPSGRVSYEAPVLRMPSGRPVPGLRLDLRTLIGLRRAIRRWRPHIVQAQGADAVKYVGLAAAGQPTRAILRWVGRPSDWIVGRSRRALYGWLLRHAAVNVAVADMVRRELIEGFDIPPDRVVTIPNAVDAGRVEPTTERAEMRRSLGIAEDAAVLLSIGAFSWEKDPLAQLDLVALVCSHRPNTVLVMVGDGPLRAEAEAEIGRRRLDGKAIMLGPRDDVANLLAASDIVAMTSRTEGLPAVAVEAGLAGVPVAGISVGALSEVVVDGVTGLLEPPGQIEALAGRVIELLDDQEVRRVMGKEARDRCRPFSMEAVAPRYLTLYRELLGEAGAS